MTAGLRLHKLHGLGNDFLVALSDELPAEADAARQAVRLCDRRLGVGADGLIHAVLDTGEGSSGERSATMRLWNSDGSAAEVSGNGLRCLAHAAAVTLGSADLEAREHDADERDPNERGAHERGAHERGAHERGAHERDPNERGAHELDARGFGANGFDIVVETVAGPRRCRIRPGGTPGTVIGTTEMGAPGLGPEPDRLSGCPEAALEGVLGPGAITRWATLDVGNPHAVLAVADPGAVPLEAAGRAVEALFDGGINVHFGVVTSTDELTLAVWERGAGATAACGTGAVAAAAAFHRWGEVGQNVTVRMAGGDALVDLSEQVTLTGESTYVATVDVHHA